MLIEILLSSLIAALVAITVFLVLSRRSQGKRITSIELQLHDAVPISVAFRATLIKKLTHNHTPRMDDLLARIDTLSTKEEIEFAELLRERVVEFNDPQIDDAERDAATMLPMMNKRVRSEALIQSQGIEVRVVLIPPAGSQPAGGNGGGR